MTGALIVKFAHVREVLRAPAPTDTHGRVERGTGAGESARARAMDPTGGASATRIDGGASPSGVARRFGGGPVAACGR